MAPAAHAQMRDNVPPDKSAPAESNRPSGSESNQGTPRATETDRKAGPSQATPRANDTSRQPRARGEDRSSTGQGRGKTEPMGDNRSTESTERHDRKNSRNSGTAADRRGNQADHRNANESDERISREEKQRRTREETNKNAQRSSEHRDRLQRQIDEPSSRDMRGHRSSERAGSDRGRRDERGVTLSNEQRERVTTRFSTSIDRLHVRPVSRSNISVSIGANVPRSVHVYDVPDDVIAVYPDFRGDKFVVVEDEIVIIEPESRRIVATLPRSGPHATTGRAVPGDRIEFSAGERRTIRTIVMREPSCRYEPRIDFTIGIPLPSAVKICEFPEEVLAEVPEARRYRFMVRDDEIVVVDPDERRVVEIID